MNSTTWIDSGAYFNAYGAALRARFGGRVQRVSIDAGFTCPNVDGTLAKGGCVFCDNRSFSPSRRTRLQSVMRQLESGMRTVRERYGKVQGFIAYFQPATNTYAPVDQLAELFHAAAAHDDVVGLAIGTRPDCVPPEVLDLIDELARDRYVSLEYGMQSIHQSSLDWMNRAHDHASMVDAMHRSRNRHFETCAHVILGVPGETHAHMMETADEVARLAPDAIKLHNLYAVKGTPLGDQVLAGEVELMQFEDYVRTVVDFLEKMPPQMIVERVSGEAPSGFLIGPDWCRQKSAIRSAIEETFETRGTRQGSNYQFAPPPVPTTPTRSAPLPPSDEPSNDTASPTDPHPATDATPEPVRRRIAGGRTLPVLRLPTN